MKRLGSAKSIKGVHEYHSVTMSPRDHIIQCWLGCQYPIECYILADRYLINGAISSRGLDWGRRTDEKDCSWFLGCQKKECAEEVVKAEVAWLRRFMVGEIAPRMWLMRVMFQNLILNGFVKPQYINTEKWKMQGKEWSPHCIAFQSKSRKVQVYWTDTIHQKLRSYPWQKYCSI